MSVVCHAFIFARVYRHIKTLCAGTKLVCRGFKMLDTNSVQLQCTEFMSDLSKAETVHI